MNKRTEREEHNLEAHFETHATYQWYQSMKHGELLEGWFYGVLQAQIRHTPGKGYHWLIHGVPLYAQACDADKYHATIATCKQDALQAVIATLEQAHRELVKETGLHIVFRDEANRNCVR